MYDAAKKVGTLQSNQSDHKVERRNDSDEKKKEKKEKRRRRRLTKINVWFVDKDLPLVKNKCRLPSWIYA